MLRLRIFVFIERQDFVSWLFSGCMLSEWSGCWRGGRNGAHEGSDRLTGRETETSLRRWQSQERRRARVHACLSRRACVRVCACVCTCGGEVPSRGATEGGWKCYWSSAPRPATWDGISAYGNQINTHTHRHTHTHTRTLSGGWCDFRYMSWMLRSTRRQRGTFECHPVEFLSLFLCLSLKRSAEVREAAECRWQGDKVEGGERGGTESDGTARRWDD